MGLKNKNSTGWDEVPPVILKTCVRDISCVLSVIFNKCMELCEFPKVLKKAVIVPIYKKDCHKDISNYRPISLLSVFSKIF